VEDLEVKMEGVWLVVEEMVVLLVEVVVVVGEV